MTTVTTFDAREIVEILAITSEAAAPMRPAAHAALAHAIEIGAVVLARDVDAEFAVAEGDVFAPEKRGRRAARAGRRLPDAMSEREPGVISPQSEPAESSASNVSARFAPVIALEVIDGGISRDRRKDGEQAGPRLDRAIQKRHVLAIGRDAERQIRRRHVRDNAAKEIEWYVGSAEYGHLAHRCLQFMGLVER